MFHRILSRGIFISMLLASPALGAENFPPEDIIQWKEKGFHGSTTYKFISDSQNSFIEAVCSSSASSLYLEQKIDLRKTPVLEWEWKVEKDYGPHIDETRKSGDDYPVRVYVVAQDGLFIKRTRVINYVWSSAQPQGSVWKNAYAKQVQMVALQSGLTSRKDRWIRETRNISDDFFRYHGIRPQYLIGIAIMTDCDDLQTDMRG